MNNLKSIKEYINARLEQTDTTTYIGANHTNMNIHYDGMLFSLEVWDYDCCETFEIDITCFDPNRKVQVFRQKVVEIESPSPFDIVELVEHACLELEKIIGFYVYHMKLEKRV